MKRFLRPRIYKWIWYQSYPCTYATGVENPIDVAAATQSYSKIRYQTAAVRLNWLCECQDRAA